MEYKKLFHKKVENCDCKKCRCERCGEKTMTVDDKDHNKKPIKVIKPIFSVIHNTSIVSLNHYRLYDKRICRNCNFQWIEQLGEQKYLTPEMVD